MQNVCLNFTFPWSLAQSTKEVLHIFTAKRQGKERTKQRKNITNYSFLIFLVFSQTERKKWNETFPPIKIPLVIPFLSFSSIHTWIHAYIHYLCISCVSARGEIVGEQEIRTHVTYIHTNERYRQKEGIFMTFCHSPTVPLFFSVPLSPPLDNVHSSSTKRESGRKAGFENGM